MNYSEYDCTDCFNTTYAEISNNELIKAFERKYPGTPFNELTKQTTKILSNDGCTYYIHRRSGTIYAWNFIIGEWNICDEPNTVRFLFRTDICKNLDNMINSMGK